MLTSLIQPGVRWTLVVGKGGVGKTTTSAALAVALADRGDEVLLMSTDPAHSLGDIFGQRLGGEWQPVQDVPRLRALEIDPGVQREAFFGRNREHLRTVLDRGTYLEGDEIETFLDLALPGMDEMAALLIWLDILRGEAPRYDRLVVDTAPTGHTLRLLESPRLASEWLDALAAMERKHSVVAGALSSGRYRGDEASRFVEETWNDVERLSGTLRDPEWARTILVTNPEAVVRAETERTAAVLLREGIPLGGIVVNRVADTEHNPVRADVPHAFVPRLDREPLGVEGVRAFARAARSGVRGACAGELAPRAHDRVFPGDPYLPPADRDLYLVVGKGGVGKSTVAAALALLLAHRVGKARLVSTDPAGSLDEVLGAGEPRPAGLEVRQLDATATWQSFRDRYETEVEAVFNRIAAGGLSLEMDREVVGRLMRLAPPGIDEVVALAEVADMREDRGAPIVLDTAPTGHLLRLLETPDIVRDWIRAILRLLLRYREVTGLGTAGESLLEMARRIRELSAGLVDPERTAALVVLLPEALSEPETRRLLDALATAEVPVERCLLNRGSSASRAQVERALRATERTRTGLVILPDVDPAPVGIDALEDFRDRWRIMEAA